MRSSQVLVFTSRWRKEAAFVEEYLFTKISTKPVIYVAGAKTAKALKGKKIVAKPVLCTFIEEDQVAFAQDCQTSSEVALGLRQASGGWSAWRFYSVTL